MLCKLCGWFLVCLARARARVRVCVCVCVHFVRRCFLFRNQYSRESPFCALRRYFEAGEHIVDQQTAVASHTRMCVVMDVFRCFA